MYYPVPVDAILRSFAVTLCRWHI